MNNNFKKALIIVACLAVICLGTVSLLNPDAFIFYHKETDFEYIEEEGGLVLTGYNGSEKNIEIPSSIDGKEVVALRGTFYENSNVTGVKIPEGVKLIDYMTFFFCSSLVRVIVPSTVEEIGNAAFNSCVALREVSFTGSGIKRIMPYAFSYCTFLNKILLPEGLTYIGERAFEGCKRLEKIMIPSTVEEIGGAEAPEGEDYAFAGCESLKITVAPGSEHYAMQDGVLTVVK